MHGREFFRYKILIIWDLQEHKVTDKQCDGVDFAGSSEVTSNRTIVQVGTVGARTIIPTPIAQCMDLHGGKIEVNN